MSQCPHIDLLDSGLYQGGAPLVTYRTLRERDPVHWHEHADSPSGGFWAVTRQQELDYVLKNPKLFSSYQRTCAFQEFDDDMLALQRTQLINLDPPEHIKYRRIVRSAFTPKAVESYRPRFEQIACEILDRVADRGECEFVEEVAAELPLIAICELMGIPLDDRRLMFEWTNTMIGADDPELSISREQSTQAMFNTYAYGAKLAELHRQSPRSNIVGMLLDGTVEGEHLNEEEFSNFFMLLVLAGNETTRTVTSHGMRLLMDHPEQYRRLQGEPALLSDAVEEFLRYNPAVVHFRRTAMVDVELGGKRIRKGDKVVVFFQSASHDENVFADPGIFDITRGTREDVYHGHRAFGIGEHFCLGANLARLELNVIFAEILRRIHNPRLAAPVRWLESNFINGIKEMRIEFDAGA